MFINKEKFKALNPRRRQEIMAQRAGTGSGTPVAPRRPKGSIIRALTAIARKAKDEEEAGRRGIYDALHTPAPASYAEYHRKKRNKAARAARKVNRRRAK